MRPWIDRNFYRRILGRQWTIMSGASIMFFGTVHIDNSLFRHWLPLIFLVPQAILTSSNTRSQLLVGRIVSGFVWPFIATVTITYYHLSQRNGRHQFLFIDQKPVEGQYVTPWSVWIAPWRLSDPSYFHTWSSLINHLGILVWLRDIFRWKYRVVATVP